MKEQNTITLQMDGFESTISHVSLLSDMTWFSKQISCAKIVFIDSNLYQAIHKAYEHTQDSVFSDLYTVLSSMKVIIVPGGEQCKQQAVFNLVLDSLFQHTLTRSDRVVVMGGGALCDVVSFVASVYMRGIPLVLIPSTLLAMVDATIGGKTAVNYTKWKNMVGTFYPATQIVVVPYLLNILSPQLMKEGCAEVIKAGMLQDDSLLQLIETHGTSLFMQSEHIYPEIWTEIIWRAVQVKVDIVQKDFKEQGIRSFLNLGHTFAHAHESYMQTQGNAVSHGNAVALGIRAALLLGMNMSKSQVIENIEQNKEAIVGETAYIYSLPDIDMFTNTVYAQRVFSLLEMLDYPTHYKGCTITGLLHAMRVDKKKQSNTLRIILQHMQGHTIMLPVPDTMIVHTYELLGVEK